MVLMDGTGINDGAVPLVDSTERSDMRKDEKKEKRAEPQVKNGMAIKDGTDINNGAVPLVDRKEKDDQIMTEIPDLTMDERKDKEMNGMEQKDGTGTYFGVVPQVVSTDMNEKKGKKKVKTVTFNPDCDIKPKSDKNYNCEMRKETISICDRGVVPRNGAVLSSEKKEGVENKGEKKRKAEEFTVLDEKKVRAPVKYIGETSRSAYERLKEHYKDFENISVKSHMLKHYFEKHKDIEMKDMRFDVKVLRSYHSAFERQIGESVYINHNLKKGTVMMNSKNEYNRCIIPRLGFELDKDEAIAEYEENEKERAVKREIQKLREKIRYEKYVQKDKRRKLNDKPKMKEVVKENVKVIKRIEVRRKEDKCLLMKGRKERIIDKIKSQSDKRLKEKLENVMSVNKKDKMNYKKGKRKREGWSVVKQRMLEAGENVDDVYGTLIGLIPEKTIIESNEAHNIQSRSPTDDPGLLTDKVSEGKSFCSLVPHGENVTTVTLENRCLSLGNISLGSTKVTNDSDIDVLKSDEIVLNNVLNINVLNILNDCN